MRQEKVGFVMSGILAVLVMALILPAETLAASKYKVLHRFNGGEDGALLTGGLIFDAAGNLYGTTLSGGAGRGAQGCGIVFELTPNSDGNWGESVLYRFAGGRDGCASNAGLIFDGAGNLYGTTTRGGNQACKRGCGVVFELGPKPDGSWTESVLHRFSGADGSYAGADLIFDAGGNLYGTTSTGGVNNPCPIEGDPGCGTVFKLTPKGDGTWTESVLYSFCSSVGCTDGIFPDGRLVSDVAGNLYGTTGGGGTPNCGGGFGCGTVFMLTPKSDGSSTYSVLHSFTSGRDGSAPSAGLIFDASGNLYGTTLYGGYQKEPCPAEGNPGCGTVFKLTPNKEGTWTETVLHYFLNEPARWPAGLVFDKAGNLYGATPSGGPVDDGVVFKLALTSNGSWKENVLQVFRGKPARDPYGRLVLDQAGNLYGTTYLCGRGKVCHGVVFEITP